MQKEKRKIRAFTEMSEDGIKALEQKMLNKVKEKILEKKQEEGGKNFDPDDYNVPIERRLIFNIDSMIRLEGVVKLKVGLDKRKLRCVVPEFYEIFVVNPVTGTLDNIDVTISSIESELIERKIDFKYTDKDYENGGEYLTDINILEDFRKFVYENDEDYKMLDLDTGETHITTPFLYLLSTLAGLYCDTIIFNKNGDIVESFVLDDGEGIEVELRSSVDYSFLPHARSQYSLDEIYNLGLLTRGAFAQVLKYLSGEYPKLYEEYFSKKYSPRKF